MIPLSVSRLRFRFSLLCRTSSLCNEAALSEGVNKLYGARQRQVSDGSRNESGELEMVEIVRRLLYKWYKIQNMCIDILCVRRFYLRIESMQRINIQTNVRRIAWTLSRKAHTHSHIKSRHYSYSRFSRKTAQSKIEYFMNMNYACWHRAGCAQCAHRASLVIIGNYAVCGAILLWMLFKLVRTMYLYILVHPDPFRYIHTHTHYCKWKRTLWIDFVFFFNVNLISQFAFVDDAELT